MKNNKMDGATISLLIILVLSIISLIFAFIIKDNFEQQNVKLIKQISELREENINLIIEKYKD